MTYKILKGNSLDLLPTLADNSIDAIVTDPPYGLGNPDPDYIIKAIQQWASGDRSHIPEGKGFMGKSWDSFVPPPAIWDECLRVLKPGGHLLAFAGTRTYDLMGISIRMAGFEIRDSIGWVYGSGFPKSLDVGKAIDKAAGAEREVLTEVVSDLFGDQEVKQERKTGIGTGKGSTAIMGDGNRDLTLPATPEAKQWQGWGTALKPALEPIVVARKPLGEKTVAANVLTHGTGGLNIDASRIAGESWGTRPPESPRDVYQGQWEPKPSEANTQGRWPANLILDEYTADLLDEQTSNLKGATSRTTHPDRGPFSTGVGDLVPDPVYGDSGGASRFFYVAKASKRDRNEGLEELEEKQAVGGGGGIGDYLDDVNSASGKFGSEKAPAKNFHPTVKPTALMQYLVKLVTPPGGTVLDPFTGSGSTGKGAILEGFDFIGIELTEDYWPIIECRLKHAEAKVAEAKESQEAQPEGLF
jgi:site-specific DNA-methyltransferase (adenine-specific)